MGNKIKYDVLAGKLQSAVVVQIPKQLLLTITSLAIIATLILLNTQLWAETSLELSP